eukprot:CAMPEP_0201565258 /NCGR_PEP_ID=MMETSP0190_2-20130828/4235_1 /ASSEMBLY_ACC=CAM_ASM_000263 /TAXON_ID=37353 /ORGANISM="Rosalina sp." /LENGTH=139 /DNA_ID=CAMNT_0047982541 /DNA_START=955 /DNA_END=1374 /DNA_ORIENTATION=-
MTINMNASSVVSSSITGEHGLDITTPTITTVQTPPITSMVAGNVSTTIPLQLPSFKSGASAPCSDDIDVSNNNDPGTPSLDDNGNVSSQENEVPSMHNDGMNSSIPMTDDENEGSFVVLEDLDNIVNGMGMDNNMKYNE